MGKLLIPNSNNTVTQTPIAKKQRFDTKKLFL